MNKKRNDVMQGRGGAVSILEGVKNKNAYWAWSKPNRVGWVKELGRVGMDIYKGCRTSFYSFHSCFSLSIFLYALIFLSVKFIFSDGGVVVQAYPTRWLAGRNGGAAASEV